MSDLQWKVVKLEDVAEIQTGISKSSSRQFKEPVELPYLRVANVQDGYLNLSTIKHIRIERGQLSRYRLCKGDVLLTEGGDFDKLGRGTVWNGEIDECVHQNHIFVVRPNKNILLSEFLSLLTSSNYGKRYFISCSKQSTNLASINSTQLKQFPVLLPNIATQEQIISILSVWGKAIEKTEALIAAKEKQFEWLCQYYFHPNNKINSAWERKKINNFLKVRNEKSTPTKERPLYSLTIENGVTAKTDRYNREFLVKNVNEKKYKVVYPKDMVFNPANLRWGAIARSELQHAVVVSPIYEVLQIDTNKIDSDFLTHALTCSRQINIFLTKVEGTLIERMAVKVDVFLLCEIFVPSTREEQKHIASILNSAKEELFLIKCQLENYRQQKAGLMQKLLTGQQRIKEQM